MQNRHNNRTKYFNEQVSTTSNFVIPYIEKSLRLSKETKVLEVGCGEGGNLVPFIERGCQVTGIDISANKIKNAKQFLADYKPETVSLICDDIYNCSDLGIFDVIFLRDVIEHIPNQDQFMVFLKNLMKAETVVFFAFPPWQNPFGGHQQICKGKLLSHLPYFHLLPTSLYRGLLKTLGESEATINGLLEIKETGISIERFENILKNSGFIIENKTLYFINPNYQTKFNLKPRQQCKLIEALHGIRNFFTTSAYYSVKIDHGKNKKSPRF